MGETNTTSFENALNVTVSRNLKSLNIYQLLAAEFSTLCFTEKTKVSVMDNNGQENEEYTKYVNNIFKQNNFHSKKMDLLEYMFAMSGSVEKIYRKNNKTLINYVIADSFVPTAWDNEKITSGIFLTCSVKNGYKYTLVEKQEFSEGIFEDEKKLYQNKTEISYKLFKNKENSLDEGIEVSVSELYPNLKDDIIYGVTAPLFSYCKPSRANNIDFDSPLGVSIFHDSTDLIEIIDRCIDSWDREFALGKKRIIVPSSAMKTYVDDNGNSVAWYDTDSDIYQGLNVDERESLPRDDTQILRVDEHITSINALLNLLCIKVGLSQGAISFDPKTGLKTATEVVSENSKTFKTKKKHEINIEKNIKEVVASIINVAWLYGDLPVQEYDVNVQFDDSIIVDKEKEKQNAKQEVTMGLLSKMTYLTKYKGYTEEEARNELKLIEGQQIDLFKEE
jgi:A118 family predicted phage portal protein